jgi:hypothetical protein
MSEEKEMRAKITITLPISLIERAKLIGVRSGKSVSEMVTESLRPTVAKLEEQFGRPYPSEGEVASRGG